VEERLYGEKGFTQREEVQNILNKYEEDELGGCVHFEALPWKEAKKLLELLPDEQKNDKQNFSPTFQEFIQWAEEINGNIWFHGYRIVPEREDERITLTGFYFKGSKEENEIHKKLKTLDEINQPDEYCLIEHPKLGIVIYVWWD